MTENILDILAQEALTEATHELAVSDTAENLWFSGEKRVDFKGRYSVILNISIRFYDNISIEKRIIVERCSGHVITVQTSIMHISKYPFTGTAVCFSL